LRSLDITSKSPSFYNQAIKALYLPYHPTDLNGQGYWGYDFAAGIKTATKLFPYCKAVEYLVCWISPPYVDKQLGENITVLRPKRLVARLKNLLGTVKPNFSLPFFDNVTHLDITDSTEWTTWSGIHCLPHLSHIMFRIDHHFGKMAVVSEAVQVVEDVLSQCETLQVCVIRYDSSDGRGRRYSSLDPFEFFKDPRLVYIINPRVVNLDWRCFVKGEPDVWVYAEYAVARNRGIGRVDTDMRLLYEGWA
jgi:hypothetical protein